MENGARLIRFEPGSELVRQIEAAEATGEPLEVDTSKHRYALYVNCLDQPKSI